jgi:hypothetical protein
MLGCLLGRMYQQSGLADPGFACHQYRLCLTTYGGREVPAEHIDLILTAHK